jgi:hypothetical protein
VEEGVNMEKSTHVGKLVMDMKSLKPIDPVVDEKRTFQP